MARKRRSRTTPREGFLTPDELVERWRGAVAEKTLRNWRHEGRGPVFQTIGRSVLYPVAEVELYEERSSSDAAPRERTPASSGE